MEVGNFWWAISYVFTLDVFIWSKQTINAQTNLCTNYSPTGDDSNYETLNTLCTSIANSNGSVDWNSILLINQITQVTLAIIELLAFNTNYNINCTYLIKYHHKVQSILYHYGLPIHITSIQVIHTVISLCIGNMVHINIVWNTAINFHWNYNVHVATYATGMYQS